MKVQFIHSKSPEAKFSTLESWTRYDAFLYDCDGTLADTMAPHKAAWVAEILSRGVQTQPQTIENLIHELAGMPAVQTVRVMNERYGWDLDPQDLAQKKEERFLREYAHLASPIIPVVEHLRKVAAIPKKIGVVSGGRTRVVRHTLEQLGVLIHVGALVCAEDVKFGKPHPEPFLMAAQALGVEPTRCLVFEDADLGVESATRAGMDWVRVLSPGI
jgi:HAD superfamily hydrolase (TIGR01509 family)